MMRTGPRVFPASVAALCLIATGAWAQTSDPAPLRNWPAPLYWQPSTSEEISIARERAHEAEPAGRRGPVPDLSMPGASASLSVFVAITPCRLVDTRLSTLPYPYGGGASAPLVWGANGGDTHIIAAPGGSCSLPPAQAYSTLVTVVPVPLGHPMQVLNAYPTGVARPFTATLTDYPGAVAGDAAVIPTGTPLGSFDVYVTDPAWVIIDVNGYYTSPSALALGAGTAAAPSLTFSNDANSGLYSPAAGTVRVTASGSDVLTVNSSGISVDGNVDLTGAITQSGQNLVQSNVNATGVGRGALGYAGGYNTALGPYALGSANSSSADNTAVGWGAAYATTSGGNNTAMGYGALNLNSTASNSTAVGFWALKNNTVGSNTAVGASALTANTTGGSNTAVGYEALTANTTGAQNAALGSDALVANTTGAGNTALGYGALNATTGSSNTAVGSDAGYSMTTGAGNTVVGVAAGYNPITGDNNTGVGAYALYSLTSGSANIALGLDAGSNLAAGSNNIDIGNLGLAADNGIIRIGSAQSATYIAGIYGNAVSGQTVTVDSTGHLGVASISSRRFKQDIRDMGDTTDVVMGLRPVRFRYKAQGPDGPEQYGLIAEEVQEVAPELVARGQDGQIDSVYYDKVNAMLLNEVQKQRRLIEAQNDAIRRLETRLAELENRN